MRIRSPFDVRQAIAEARRCGVVLTGLRLPTQDFCALWSCCFWSAPPSGRPAVINAYGIAIHERQL